MLCDLFFAWGNFNVSAESREVCLLETKRDLIVGPPSSLAKTEVHNGSVRPISDESWDPSRALQLQALRRGPAMKAMKRCGMFAYCRVKQPCKSRCVCFLRESYKNRAFRGIHKRRRIKRESKHDQTALRKDFPPV